MPSSPVSSPPASPLPVPSESFPDAAGGVDQFRAALRATLEQADGPLTIAQLSARLPGKLPGRLSGPVKAAKQTAVEILEAEVARGTVFRYGSPRSPQYWTRDVADFSRSTILGLLAKRSRTRVELAKALETPLAQISREKRQKFVGDLLRAGEIRELPLLLGTRAKRLGVAAPDPREYLVQALDEICRRLSAAGVATRDVLHAARQIADERIGDPAGGEAEVRAATGSQAPDASPVTGTGSIGRMPSPERCCEIVLDGMAQVEPGAHRGALVPVRDVRRLPEMTALGKAAFDAAVLSLSELGKIALHRHDYPSSLTETERDLLVPDGFGNFYIGMTLRR